MSASNEAALQTRFLEAVTAHGRSAFAEAETICEAIVVSRPDHYGALHLLGVIAFQTGRPDRALELFGQAIATRPNSPEAHINFGTVLLRLGRAEAALAAYDQAIAIDPRHADAHYNRANASRHLGRTREALDAYDRAIAARPGFAEAHYNRANVLRDLGDLAAALSGYDTAAELRPEFTGVHNNRGKVLRDLGRYEEALVSHDRVIALKPDFAEAHNNRGNALRDLERYAEALASYDKAIALKPDFAVAHNNRGTVLAELERPGDALSSYDAAIGFDPAFAEAHNNRGNALADLGAHDDAARSFWRAIDLKPDLADAYDNLGALLAGLGRAGEALFQFDHALALDPRRASSNVNRGNALRDRGRHAEAMVHYRAAIEARPDFAAAHWNQSLCQLAMGDYENGWKNFEWRWKSELARARRDLPGRLWLGDFPIDGATIYVHPEQGLGDILQFCRYVPLLATRARVVLEVPRPLRRLLSGLDGVTRVIESGDPSPPFDVWTPLMSLPLAFGTTLDTIPAAVPYLHADPERAAVWKHRLAALPGRKVGLVWAGSPRHGQPRADLMDRRRSMPLQQFAPLATVSGIAFISLQKGEPAAQARTPPDGMTLHDWTEELDDFADTAALIEALDLVISVDTSVVHLAGALGKPVWVLNRYDQCWRWLCDRLGSPWYPTARLFRQHSPGDWSGMMRDVTAALRAWR